MLRQFSQRLTKPLVNAGNYRRLAVQGYIKVSQSGIAWMNEIWQDAIMATAAEQEPITDGLFRRRKCTHLTWIFIFFPWEISRINKRETMTSSSKPYFVPTLLTMSSPLSASFSCPFPHCCVYMKYPRTAHDSIMLFFEHYFCNFKNTRYNSWFAFRQPLTVILS